MIRIPELSQRSTPSLETRNTPRLNVPAAFDRAGSANSAKEQIKPILSGAKQIAGVYYDMKERYDKAKAFQFLSSFIESSNNQFAEYEKNNRGINAVGLTAQYREWAENEFAKGQVADGENGSPMLENRDQIDIARKFFDRYNLGNVNRVSQFEARQLIDYENKQYASVVSSTAASIPGEQDPMSIGNKVLIVDEANKHIYPGQSKEFYNRERMKVVSPALRANVEETAINDPDGAIASLSSKLFKKEMTDEDYMSAKKGVIKAFVSNKGKRMGEEWARGVDFQFDMKELDNKFFEGYDREKLRNEIVKVASETKAEIEKKQDAIQTDLQNDTMVNSNVVSENGIRFDNLSEEEKGAIYSGAYGADFRDMVVNIGNQALKENALAQDGKPLEITEEDLSRYGDIMAKLSARTYAKFSDMKDDIEGLPYSMLVNVLNEFGNHVFFDRETEKIKRQTGVDLNKVVETSFKNLTGVKDLSRSRMYPEFRDEMVGRIVARMSTGDKVDYNMIEETARNYFKENKEDESLRGILTRVFQEVDNRISGLKSSTPLSNEMVEDYVKDVLSGGWFGSDAFDFEFSKENERRLVEAIASGNFDKAYGVLWSQQFYETKMLNKKKAEGKIEEQERLKRRQIIKDAKEKASQDPFAPNSFFNL